MLTQIVVVDDHPVIALGIRLAIHADSGFEIAEITTSPARAVEVITRLQPGVIVCDLIFDGVVQMPLITQCRSVMPSAAIVVFSSLPPKLFERDCLDAGADAYVPKASDLSNLIATIASVLKEPRTYRAPGNGGFAHAKTAEPAVQNSQLEEVRFTPREHEVGRLLSLGRSVNRIAQEMALSPNTVAVHRDNIRRKLACRDSTELIARLVRLYGTDQNDVR